MTSRQALPVGCTQGFKSLRTHVKLTKESVPEKPKIAPQPSSKTEREQEWEENGQLEPLVCNGEEQARRIANERNQHEERQLNAIRLTLAKEHRELKTRERAVKSMESALQDAMERTAQKETNLDSRIQDIARLEQRLHEALTQSILAAPATERENSTSATEVAPANEEIVRRLEEREALLALQQQELALARDQITNRDRHLTTKERVLRDKAAELQQLQNTLELKDRQLVASANERLAQLERELQQRYTGLEQELTDRFQAQLQALHTEFETKRQILEESARESKEEFDRQIRTQTTHLAERETHLAEKEARAQLSEELLKADISRLQEQQQEVEVKERKADMALEDAIARMVILEHRAFELAERLNEADDRKAGYDEGTERLRIQEQKLAMFAAEVESQHQSNVMERDRLEQERTAQRLAAEAAAAASVSVAETLGPAPVPSDENQQGTTKESSSKPPSRRSLTSALFRTKSVNRS